MVDSWFIALFLDQNGNFTRKLSLQGTWNENGYNGMYDFENKIQIYLMITFEHNFFINFHAYNHLSRRFKYNNYDASHINNESSYVPEYTDDDGVVQDDCVIEEGDLHGNVIIDQNYYKYYIDVLKLKQKNIKVNISLNNNIATDFCVEVHPWFKN